LSKIRPGSFARLSVAAERLEAVEGYRNRIELGNGQGDGRAELRATARLTGTAEGVSSAVRHGAAED
jgi:hypothetical protein